MDNVQNCDSYINVTSPQTYREHCEVAVENMRYDPDIVQKGLKKIMNSLSVELMVWIPDLLMTCPQSCWAGRVIAKADGQVWDGLQNKRGTRIRFERRLNTQNALAVCDVPFPCSPLRMRAESRGRRAVVKTGGRCPGHALPPATRPQPHVGLRNIPTPFT
jgi:hypothetical protein